MQSLGIAAVFVVASTALAMPFRPPHSALRIADDEVWTEDELLGLLRTVLPKGDGESTSRHWPTFAMTPHSPATRAVLRKLGEAGPEAERRLALEALGTNARPELCPFWRAIVAAAPPASLRPAVARGLLRCGKKAESEAEVRALARKPGWETAVLQMPLELDWAFTDFRELQLEPAVLLGDAKAPQLPPERREAAFKAALQGSGRDDALRWGRTADSPEIRRISAVLDDTSDDDALLDALRSPCAGVQARALERLSLHLRYGVQEGVRAPKLVPKLAPLVDDPSSVASRSPMCLFVVAVDLDWHGDFARAETLYRRALDHEAGPGAGDHLLSRRIGARYMLARLLWLTGRHDEARAVARALSDVRDHDGAGRDLVPYLHGLSNDGPALSRKLLEEFDAPVRLRVELASRTRGTLVVQNVSAATYELVPPDEHWHAGIWPGYVWMLVNGQELNPRYDGDTITHRPLALAPGATATFPLNFALPAGSAGRVRVDAFVDVDLRVKGAKKFEGRVQSMALLEP